MEEFGLNQKVVIRATGVEGTVIGVWHSAFGQPQYNIRYYDTTNRLADSWLTASEIKDAG